MQQQSALAPLRRAAAVSALFLIASCGDDPSSPEGAGIPATISATGGAAQNAIAGEAVPIVPAVIVRDALGNPVPGVHVQFVVVQGGGTVDSVSALTKASGVASAGAWTLGPLPGEHAVEASIDELPPVRFTAQAGSGFQIEVRYVSSASARQRDAVAKAVARWRSILVRDLIDIPLNVQAGACVAGQPALAETVDDLLIFVQFSSIDGPGDVLGRAGPCYIRAGSDLPVLAVLSLDTADLTQLEANGLIDDVVLHEMGHALGIGTLWSTRGLLAAAGGADPQFLGPDAIAVYHQLGGSAPAVPVENTGGSGSRDSHWRESVFGHELMTAFLSAAVNPLSALTVASLEDLGYTTDASTAAAYTLAGTTAPDVVLDLRGREDLVAPTHRVDAAGTTTRITVGPNRIENRGVR